MYIFLVVLALCGGQIKGQTTEAPGESWVKIAKVVDYQQYFMNVMQEFVYELEREDWSNLKLTDIRQNISTIVANRQVTGTVLYTNGFVVSIQKLDISDLSSGFTKRIVDGVLISSANVRGRLNFRNMNIGYDVISDLAGIGKQRYTGEILCDNVAWDFVFTKNMITQVTTMQAWLGGILGPNIRMIYRPENQITELLSRSIKPDSNASGISAWRDKFHKIITDIMKNKIQFPRVCFNDCT